MKHATIADAPAVLNTNDKAMWVLGFNAAADRATLTREQIVAGLNAARKVEHGFDFGDGSTAAERESDRVFAFRAAVIEAAHVSGVAPSVPVNRPATLEEANHAAQIGACLPNGVMFDYLGNPRKRYTRVSLDGSHLILDDAQLAEHKANASDPDEYTYSDVYLSQEEADALPEFDGF